jgi:hypothetical protein
MTYYVYSTATNHNKYTEWHPRPGGKDTVSIPTVKRSVLIKGGAGIARNPGLITPFGVRTAIEDTDYEWLKDDPAFKRHVAAGFVKVSKSATDPDKAADSMKQRDGSAPLVPNDFKASGANPPTTQIRTESNSAAQIDFSKGGTPPTTKPRSVPLSKRQTAE